MGEWGPSKTAIQYKVIAKVHFKRAYFLIVEKYGEWGNGDQEKLQLYSIKGLPRCTSNGHIFSAGQYNSLCRDLFFFPSSAHNPSFS